MDRLSGGSERRIHDGTAALSERRRPDCRNLNAGEHDMSAMTENEWRYNQLIKIFPSEAEPPFEDEDQLKRWWGRPWGCRNDVGRLRAVLMHRPGPEVNVVDTSKRLEIGAYGDVQAGWYWRGTE